MELGLIPATERVQHSVSARAVANRAERHNLQQDEVMEFA
jgi:hypothetical protein